MKSEQMDKEQSPQQSSFKRSKQDTVQQPEQSSVASGTVSSDASQSATGADTASGTSENEIITLDELDTEKKLLREEYKHKIEQISKVYIRIYDIFFGYGVTIIVTILAFVLALVVSKVSAGTSFPLRSSQDIHREDTLKRKLDLTNQKLATKNHLKVVIEQGRLSIAPQEITSYDNLVTYKSFVLPRTIVFDLLSGAINNLRPITDFVNNNYELTDIDEFIKAFIVDTYIPPEQYKGPPANSIPLKSDMIDYFGIRCLLYPQVPGNWCGNAFALFLEKFKYYDMSTNYSQLQKITERVINTPDAQPFCLAITDYMFISNDTSETMRDIIIKCDVWYGKVFTDFNGFRSIQEQLLKGTINATVVKSSLLNGYKLLSTMQQIYYEITKMDFVNPISINSYTAYVQALLKDLKDDSYFQKFYFDVIARFNNAFLIPKLKAVIADAKRSGTEQYKDALSNLRELNQGNRAKLLPGLNEKVKLSELIVEQEEFDRSNSSTPPVVKMSLSGEFLANYFFDNYLIDSVVQTSETTLHTLGRIRGAAKEGIANNSPRELEIEYHKQNNSFLVTSVKLPRHPELERGVNEKLKQQPLSIAQSYDVMVSIQKRESAVTNANTISVCERFAEDTTLTSCSDTQAKFHQEGVDYVFNFGSSKGVTSYSISNKALFEQVKAEFGMPVVVTYDAGQAIALVLGYREEEQEEDVPQLSDDFTGGFADIQVQKNINEIGGTVTRIVIKSNQRIVYFTLQNINFAGVYDYSTNALTTLGVVKDASFYQIRNFQLNFTTLIDSERSLLANDPISFLMKFDPFTIKKLGY